MNALSETTQALDVVVQSIFTSMVGLPLKSRTDDAPVPELHVTAVVGIGGGTRRYAIILETTDALACRVAAALLQEDVSAWCELAGDAMGELANMIAGNLKSVLPEAPNLKLSLPIVIHGERYEMTNPARRTLLERLYVCHGEIIRRSLGDNTVG